MVTYLDTLAFVCSMAATGGAVAGFSWASANLAADGPRFLTIAALVASVLVGIPAFTYWLHLYAT